MIAPKVHTGQSGVLGAQHGLQKLTETLEALSTGQQAQQTSDTQMQQQLTTQAAVLTQLRGWLRWQGYALAALGVTTLLLAGCVGWQVWHPPEQAYVRALGALDQTIVQQWSGLPKGSQEALISTYGRVGMAPPGQRK